MRRSLSFIGKQLLRMAGLLLCAAIVTFMLVSASPLDPLQVNLGQAILGGLSAEQIEKAQAYWGTELPAAERFLRWGSGVLQGDWGISLRYREPVTVVLWEKLSQSILLLVFAWIVSGVVGFTLGVMAGTWQGRWPDRIIRGYALLISGTPTFWLAILLLLVFAVWIPLFPIGMSAPIGAQAAAVSFMDRLRHAVLPTLALSITGVANIALHTREKLIDVLGTDYALFAAARGDSPWRIVRRHGLRNILMPAITLQFASVGEIIGGSVLVEQVFSYPGLGQAAVTAGLGGDIPLLMGITLLCVLFVFIGNLCADILYGIIDPRMRRRATAP